MTASELKSVEYCDAMRSAWRQVELLRKSGEFTTEWIVQRARCLYRQAWREEKRRMNTGETAN